MQKQKSFTLIEIVVVVVVIGLLAVALIPKLNGAFQNTRNRLRVTHLREINNASLVFKSDYGYFQTLMIELLSGGYLKTMPINPFAVETKVNPAYTPGTSWFAGAGVSDTGFYNTYAYDYYREFTWTPIITTPVTINKPSRGVIMALLETLDNYAGVYDATGNNNYRNAIYNVVRAHLPYGGGPGVPAFNASLSPYEATQQGYNISGWVFYYIKMK